jgi:L-alanine-DL-glutamate epimerase-like enolase superfamily enzyme
MRLTYRPIQLKLKHTFPISRSAADVQTNVIVTPDEGIGEAAPSEYYNENADTVVDSLEKSKDELGDDPCQIESILSNLNEKITGNFSAKAGIDIALHDLIGKRLGVPIYKLLGLNGKAPLVTSYTIGIDTPEKMKEKTNEAKDFLIYKVKVGVENDIEMVKAVRETTDAKIRVDANAGWTPDEAIEKINRLAEYDIEFVEQPTAPEDKEGLKKIKKNVDVPIIIDEHLMTSEDILQFVGLCDGINIKLAKCGGIREALRMIHVARAHDLLVMLGCMIESSVGITAAAHIGSLVDFLDLDGNLLLTNDPYVGVRLEIPPKAGLKKGKLYLSDSPGLGVVPKEDQ